jgi:hypothetical protein
VKLRSSIKPDFDSAIRNILICPPVGYPGAFKLESDESDQQIYQKLMELSKTEQKTEQLSDYYEMRMIEFRFRGISRLPDEKRRRAEALYNKAATLGTELP